uniref:Reverse transcriptase zinc-binding domain-containing protein n=1 Tax=Oryza sativa subsp. japonica TaxID=39947 RepID=Q33AZ2_ORYSJ|nr:hypothetical protein LOC_Os10g06790 [Oryza sativa Japonica Group]
MGIEEIKMKTQGYIRDDVKFRGEGQLLRGGEEGDVPRLRQGLENGFISNASPAMLCPMHQERLTNKEVDEMIHETGGGRWINYKEFEVHNGRNAFFWKDVWCDRVPLKVLFPDLYEISYDQGATVNDLYEGGGWKLDFRRNLNPMKERVKDTDMWEIWKSKLPLKVKHFLYLVGRGRLPCAEQLVKRKWKVVMNSKWCALLKEEDWELLGRWCEAIRMQLIQVRPQVLPTSL